MPTLVDAHKRGCDGGLMRPVRRRAPPRRARRDAGRPRGAPVADAVLTQTLEELAANGIEGLSVERIAQRAEVNKTSVYRRWPTREALVAAALERIADGVVAQAPDTGSLEGDLLGLLAPVVFLLEQPLGRAVLRAGMAETASTAVAALAARKFEEHAVGPVKTLMKRARARGEWRDGLGPEVVFGALVGAVVHRVMLERAPASRAWLRALVELVLRGAAPRARRRKGLKRRSAQSFRR